MDMTVQSKTADPILTVANTGQNSQSQKTSDKKNDFGSMVRQKQQDARTARSQDSGKTASRTQNRSTESSSSAQEQQDDVPAEQYVIAAALILPPNLDIINFDVTPEEKQLQVELKPEFLPDMHIEAVSNLPVESPADTQNQTMFRNQNDDRQEIEFHPEEVVERMEQPAAVEEEENNDTAVQIEDVQWETPVFGYMDAAPVKVSSTQETPVDLQSDNGIEQFAARIDHLIVEDNGASRVEFTLVPASLGRITVEISRNADGALHIQINATTMRAADLLQRSTGTLQHLLGADTRPEVRIDVRTSEDTPLMYFNPNDDGRQQEQHQQGQQQRRERQQKHQTQDFIQQLRLGLVNL